MFDPKNWYWVSASLDRIYSSAKQAVLEKNDKDFSAWQDAGNSPTPWPKNDVGEETDEALVAVLAGYGLKMFPPTLSETKESLKLKVDTAAEKERLKYITNGVGQSMTYTEKFNQAVGYSKKYAAHKQDPKNEPEPNEADYLLLKAGLGIDGKTLIEVAATVTYAYAVWQKIGAAIEATRLESKAAIENAKTAEEAQAVFDTIKWPQPGQLQ